MDKIYEDLFSVPPRDVDTTYLSGQSYRQWLERVVKPNLEKLGFTVLEIYRTEIGPCMVVSKGGQKRNLI